MTFKTEREWHAWFDREMAHHGNDRAPSLSNVERKVITSEPGKSTSQLHHTTPQPIRRPR